MVRAAIDAKLIDWTATYFGSELETIGHPSSSVRSLVGIQCVCVCAYPRLIGHPPNQIDKMVGVQWVAPRAAVDCAYSGTCTDLPIRVDACPRVRSSGQKSVRVPGAFRPCAWLTPYIYM